jgi:hypothetical protein
MKRRFGEPRQAKEVTLPTKPDNLEKWLEKWDVHLSQTSLEELLRIMGKE